MALCFWKSKRNGRSGCGDELIVKLGTLLPVAFSRKEGIYPTTQTTNTFGVKIC